MKTFTLCTVGLASVAVIMPVQAQGGMMMRSNAVMKALDVDGDGTLSMEEIDHAPTALKYLDEDGDRASHPGCDAGSPPCRRRTRGRSRDATHRGSV